MIALAGFDGFFYSIGFLVAYLVVLYLVAEPLRNLRKYTMADMIAARFNKPRVRGVAAMNAIVISIFYMIAQLVGAGALIELLLGIPYTTSVIVVGILMTVYVVFGGMTATSWVQITKAVLLMIGTAIVGTYVTKSDEVAGNFERILVKANTGIDAKTEAAMTKKSS